METPPPIPQEQPKAQPEQVIDPLFLKSENEILNGLIERECEKVGFDIKRDSLNHFEKKKLTATLISAPINLIIIILFRTFHYADGVAVFLILINFLIWRKFQKSDVNTFLVKEIKLRQREKFSDVIAPQLFEKCKNQKWLRIAILAAFTFVIPIIMFFKPHIFYEDAPDGMYIRFYTEGLTGSEELVIPETVDGVTVKGIRGDVFRNTSLERVTLPNTIDTIRGHAFEGCSQLLSINIPKNVKSIGAYAFSECENLLYVEFPESLKHIGAYAFNHCEQLSINNLPQQMDSIGAYAFQSCWKIKELTIPENLTEIHAFCFSCTGITSITIPASVERIGEQAFSNSFLETLQFEDNSQLTRIGSRAFYFTKLTEVTIPPSVKEIRGSAFRNCDNLNKAIIPQDCEVADKAFKDSPTEIERY